MGCGRSTMESDSPSKSSKQDEEWSEGSVTSTKHNALHPATVIGSPNQQLPFNNGGALLAQAKISGSQLNFFRVLDEKIESGPDYIANLEDESILQKSCLRRYLEQWNKLTSGREESNKNMEYSESIFLMRPCQYQKTGIAPGDDNGGDDSDEEEDKILCEPVKEQYTFMGSLYTLTKLSTDGSYIPKVDICPLHTANGATQEFHPESKLLPWSQPERVGGTPRTSGGKRGRAPPKENFFFVKSTTTQEVVLASVMSGLAEADDANRDVCLGNYNDVNANDTNLKEETRVIKRWERADTPFHEAVNTPVDEAVIPTMRTLRPRNPPRPASLVLKTIFTKIEETS